MLNLFPFLFVLVFVIVIGVVVYSIVNQIRNARAPQETAFVRVVAKRTDVQRYTNPHNSAGAGHISQSSRTYYYITLEYDNGVRKEFLDVKNLYGIVVEGDTGYAATKGDWVVAFERSVS